MMNPKLKLSLTTVALLSLAAAAWSQRNAFDAAKPDGYFWYKDKPKQVQKKEPQPEEKAPQPQPAAQSQSPVLKPGSAEWFRQTEQKLLDNLSSDPSEKNALAYKAFERLRNDRVDEVARTTEKILNKYPYLSEAVRVPIAAHARQQALWQIDQAKEGIIGDLRNKAGLWMFFDSNCNFCHAQYETVKMLEQKYRIEVRYISIDGGVIKGMNQKQVRFDNGGSRARQFGIKVTPAVVMVVPPENAAVIAHGAMSLSDLEEKIVTAAIDMKIADPKLTRTTKMNERGMIEQSDWEAAGFTGTETPEELSEKIYRIITKKMEQ